MGFVDNEEVHNKITKNVGKYYNEANFRYCDRVTHVHMGIVMKRQAEHKNGPD